MKHYKLHVNDIEFVAISKGRDIFVGNPYKPQHPCVHLVREENTLHIANLSYFQSCSLDEQMRPGEQGTKPMVQAAIAFAKKKFSEVTLLALQDSSGYKDKNTYVHVELANWSMLNHGKTWYQRLLEPLRLRPQQRGDRDLVKEYREHLADSKYRDERFALHPVLARDADYKASSTWREYFMKKGASACTSFIRNVLKLPSLQGMEWVAPLVKIPASWPRLYVSRLPKEEQNYAVQWGGVNSWLSPVDQWGKP